MTLSALPPMAAFGDLPVDPDVDTVAVDLPIGRLSAYRVEPDGPSRGTVLFVPGYTGSKEDFRVFLPLVRAAGWSALAFSRRGQGDSAAPRHPAEYSLAEEAADVVRVASLIDDGAPVHLLGHSLGGIIGRAAALRSPSSFASYTMLCSGPHGWPNRKYLERHLVAEQGGQALWEALTPATIGVTDAELAERDPELAFQRFRWSRTSDLSLIGGGEILELADDTTEALRATGLPLLVAHGIWDEAWPVAWQRDMAERLGARYEVIDDAYHSPQVENPPATLSVLDAFWSQVTPA